ncbi:DUF2062 domain-containing protein [Pseudooceanicola sp. HF7]|uniref:DUF2062 domain-containing protein n=1 Tax=Pseudooceanicola sp. HF7 TaxID=2721560 RepID=UPI00142F4A7D|nr:DUF2062 domain-containing protein [Pseudooceanicola sp. HF7]NIZ11283.1 DUF2062 domain-containing protein [Pseudooceanicola sp. HF7]
MVFKRRDRRPFWKIISDFLWPRGGWTRAFHYTKHRLRRLPDSPEKISRGIAAGVFTVFTPFYGLHFVVSALLALIVRGNVIAAILATFVSNPVTFVPISVISLQTGYFIVNTAAEHGIGEPAKYGFHPQGGLPDGPPAGLIDDLPGISMSGPHGLPPAQGPEAGTPRSFGGMFVDASYDLWENFMALFTDAEAHWDGLRVFYHEVFFPYMIGGIAPGLICGLAAYLLTVPVIRAYQTRRRGALKTKLAAIRAKSGQPAPKHVPKPKAKPATESGKGG